MPTYEVTGPDGTKYRVTAPEGATENDALNKVREKVKSAPPTWADIGSDVSHFPERAVRGAVALPALALHGVEAATGKGLGELTGGLVKSMDESEIGKQLAAIPEAKTTVGRYGGAISEAAGGLLPGAGAINLVGRGLGAAGLRGAGEFLTRAAERPLSALNVTSAVGGGALGQAAEDADLGGLGQFGGGIVGGILAPLGAQGLARTLGPTAQRLLGSESGALRFRPPPGRPGPGEMHGDFMGPDMPAGPPRPANTPPQMSSAVDARTDQIIADIMTRANLTEDQALEVLRQAQRSGTFHGGGATASAVDPLISLAEVHPAFAQAVGSAVRHDPAAAMEARAVLKARKTGNLPETAPEQAAVTAAGIPTEEVMTPSRYTRQSMKDNPVGIMGRVVQATRKALRIDSDPYHGFGNTTDETHAMITQAQKAAAGPAYNAVWHAGGVEPPIGSMGPHLPTGPAVDVGANPGVNRVFQDYKRLADPSVSPKDIAKVYSDALEQFAPNGNKVHPSIWYVDQAKQAVDEQINKLMNSSNDRAPTLAAKLIQMKNDLIGAVDNIETNGLGTKYKAARDIFAGPEELKRDLQLGHDIYNGDKGIGEFHAASDRAQKNRIKHGYQSALINDARQMKSNQDATNLLASEQKRMELSGLIEKEKPGRVYEDRPERLGRFLQGQSKQIASEQIISGGSQTAERTIHDVQFSVLHQISDIAKDANATAILTRTGEMVLNQMFGLPSDVAVNLQRKLLSTNPDVQRRALRSAAMLVGKSKLQRYLDIMERQTRGMPAGVTSTTAGSIQQGLE
jgi:hypothetical protein